MRPETWRFLRADPSGIPLAGWRRFRLGRALGPARRRLLRLADPKRPTEVSPFVNPLAPKTPHFAPKAKSVIFLFMYGGPSHIDTFDYKPAMIGRDNQTVKVKTAGRGGNKNEGRIVEPRWKFQQYGQSGKWVSDLFPNVARHVDDIAFLHSMTADSPQHGSAMLQMNSGKILSGSPCLGSWVNYGLGTVNQDLPGFVVMLDPRGRPDQRRQELVERLHAGPLRRARLLRSGEAPILDLDRPSRTEAGRPARPAERPPRIQRRPPIARRRLPRPRRPDRQLRTRVQDAEFRARGRRPGPGDPRRPDDSTAWIGRRPSLSAASACWPVGWSSEASGSSRSTPAATTTTRAGMPTATSSRTTTSTAARPTSPSPA